MSRAWLGAQEFHCKRQLQETKAGGLPLGEGTGKD
jgi:hypothetical protein